MAVQTYPFFTAHRDDFTLKVSAASVPVALVDAKLTKTVVSGILVGLGNNPSRRIRDSQVQDLTLGNEVVETLHELRDGGREVPPVHVEQVDVVRLQLLQACLHRSTHALGAIASEVGHLETVSQAQVVIERLVARLRVSLTI